MKERDKEREKEIERKRERERESGQDSKMNEIEEKKKSGDLTLTRGDCRLDLAYYSPPTTIKRREKTAGFVDNSLEAA